MNLYGKLLEAGYFLLSKCTPYKVWKYYKELLKNQYLPEEELRTLQWEKLKRMIRHAYEDVPFYRKKFAEAGILPTDIQNKEDLRKVPFTTREELSAAFPHDVTAKNFIIQDLIPIQTSGTSTEKPFKLYIDLDGMNRKYALLLRNYSYFNWHFGKKIMSLWNKAHEDYRPLKQRSLAKTFIYKFAHRKKTLPLFAESTKLDFAAGMDYYLEIKDFRPHLLEGDAIMLYHIGRFLEREKLAKPRLEAISSATCATTASIRKRISEMFGCPVYNNYGPHEMEGIACECEARDGLHQSIDSYYIEFIREDRRALENELSELVLTDLDNFAMPLIRYKIGDLARAGIFKCSCGRTLPLMKDVEGRASDALKTERGLFSETCIKLLSSNQIVAALTQSVDHDGGRSEEMGTIDSGHY